MSLIMAEKKNGFLTEFDEQKRNLTIGYWIAENAFHACHLSHWLVNDGILIMVDYNPYIIG